MSFCASLCGFAQVCATLCNFVRVELIESDLVLIESDLVLIELEEEEEGRFFEMFPNLLHSSSSSSTKHNSKGLDLLEKSV